MAEEGEEEIQEVSVRLADAKEVSIMSQCQQF